MEWSRAGARQAQSSERNARMGCDGMERAAGMQQHSGWQGKMLRWLEVRGESAQEAPASPGTVELQLADARSDAGALGTLARDGGKQVIWGQSQISTRRHAADVPQHCCPYTHSYLHSDLRGGTHALLYEV